MKNYIQPGVMIPVIAPANVSSGQAVEVGEIVGVCATDALSGEEVEISTQGVFELPCVAADDIAIGDRLYLNNSGEATKTATDNPTLGIAVTEAGVGESPCRVRINLT